MKAVRARLEEELKALERELTVDLPREIKTAVAMGDLRENAEYHAALERQRYVGARIGQLRTRLSELGTMNLDRVPRDRVGLGSTIVMIDLAADAEITYELVIPELDVRENAKSMTIEVELPGVDEKDVSVTLANGLLTVKGEKKHEHEEKDESHYLSERSFGAFERCLRLPETIDENKLEARFDKGVLKIIAPKKPEAIKAERKIEIKKA